MREEKLMQSIRNATLEEVRKIATMIIKTSMDSDYGGMFVARGVTHWMPLPNPPKSEEV